MHLCSQRLSVGAGWAMVVRGGGGARFLHWIAPVRASAEGMPGRF
jgi:hypothetical protein